MNSQALEIHGANLEDAGGGWRDELLPQRWRARSRLEANLNRIGPDVDACVIRFQDLDEPLPHLPASVRAALAHPEAVSPPAAVHGHEADAAVRIPRLIQRASGC